MSIDSTATRLATEHSESGIAPHVWHAGVNYHALRNVDMGLVRPATIAAHDTYEQAVERVTELHGPRGAHVWDSLCARAVVDDRLAPDPLAGLTGARVAAMFGAAVR